MAYKEDKKITEKVSFLRRSSLLDVSDLTGSLFIYKIFAISVNILVISHLIIMKFG